MKDKNEKVEMVSSDDILNMIYDDIETEGEKRFLKFAGKLLHKRFKWNEDEEQYEMREGK